MAKFVQIALLLVIYFTCNANAIKCYKCKSLTDPKCAIGAVDPSVEQVDCDLVPKPNVMDALLPVKKCNLVVTSDNAGKIISRDCHFEVVGQKDNECVVSHSRHVETCHICQGDLCNASSAGRFTVLAGLTLLLATVTFIF